MSNFSERLNELMFYADNIKSDKLGEALGVSGQNIRAWCDGAQMPSLSNAIKLADYFHCSIEFLLGRTETVIDYAPKVCPNFYERFRAVMRERGVTRYRMTKESKIKDSYFTCWKQGSEPLIVNLIAAADYLGVTVDYLVGRDS